MRDNWMDLADFNVGDEQFEVTHSLLVDRLKFLPNNTIEGEQVILVRAISEDKASTNLAVGINIIGEEKIEKAGDGGSFLGVVVGILALTVLLLIGALGVTGWKLRERGYFDNDEYDEEMEDAVESIMSDGTDDYDDDGD
ncbi:MAG TPA: hypothetical protein HA303_00610, partial [Candidatus Thalassarchaeaceae archaeon]